MSTPLRIKIENAAQNREVRHAVTIGRKPGNRAARRQMAARTETRRSRKKMATTAVNNPPATSSRLLRMNDESAKENLRRPGARAPRSRNTGSNCGIIDQQKEGQNRQRDEQQKQRITHGRSDFFRGHFRSLAIFGDQFQRRAQASGGLGNPHQRHIGARKDFRMLRQRRRQAFAARHGRAQRAREAAQSRRFGIRRHQRQRFVQRQSGPQ